MARHIRTPPTIRAITGLRAPPARRNSATSTAPAAETLPGTRPTPRAAAARKVWSPPAARATFIASPLTNLRFHRRTNAKTERPSHGLSARDGPFFVGAPVVAWGWLQI